MLTEPVTVSWSSHSVHSQGSVALLMLKANPPRPEAGLEPAFWKNTSPMAGLTGKRMPPRLTPTVGRSIAWGAAEAMLKKSYISWDGAHQPPPAVSASALPTPSCMECHSSSTMAGLVRSSTVWSKVLRTEATR